jgi:hypothetical protein
MDRRGVVVDYRRGLEQKNDELVWQKHWHFDEHCSDYPRRSFEVRKERPPVDDLCPQCRGS